MRVTFNLRNYGFVGLLDPASDLGSCEKIERIHRNQSPRFTQRRQLCIEAGWPIAAPQQTSLQIPLRKGEHRPALIQRSAPGNDVMKFHFLVAITLWSQVCHPIAY